MIVASIDETCDKPQYHRLRGGSRRRRAVHSCGRAPLTSLHASSLKTFDTMGQPVVVENRLGADGIVAVTSFVNARDDHTLLFSFAGPISINP